MKYLVMISFFKKGNGNVYGWGDKLDLGIGPGTGNQYTPTQIGISNVKRISAGGLHCLALLSIFFF